ncbi:crotonase/enoyl-CoA hydratase family protein [Loktanella sp. M215]|uniref:crotonase/enoyl-CoA hydratase family protein n=1 Tax=Loktanella sp. M215 TaxID=2675431 RepID=UPI001F24A696|nr:crotonase/enoyl-CoA hydratase family protein [Loktanella sp. M215]MCF7698680.1 crotonase/enoyl-CoA hydratase family protein [Loktanella sp. M215]
MDQALVTYETEQDVAVLTMNRPEKRNALSDRVIDALDAGILRAQQDARAIVICGNGDHFSAGLDLAEHAVRSPIEGVHHSRRWHGVFDRLEQGAIPAFAALHGAVVGGGLELAAACHVRVADETTFFALPEGTRGIFVGGGGSVRAGRLMGVARMTDMMLTGRSVDARQGEAWNLCQYVVPAGEARAKAVALAAKAAQNAPMSNYAIINALPRINDMGRSDGFFVESFVSAMTASSPEAEARLRAFLDKRAAKVARPE